MYLTRMELDTSKRRTVIAFTKPSLFHGAVEEAFAQRERKLWRIDKLAGRTYLLLLSSEKPDLGDAARQFGTENGWETRDYAPFLERIRTGDRRRFRLTASPVIAKKTGNEDRGKLMAHVTVAWQEKWLADRAAKNGFALSPDEFSAVGNQWVSFNKGRDGRNVTFRQTTFEGLLTVTDEELFRAALQNGIGREKAYGCGLLTVTGREP